MSQTEGRRELPRHVGVDRYQFIPHQSGDIMLRHEDGGAEEVGPVRRSGGTTRAATSATGHPCLGDYPTKKSQRTTQ
jgi:hypothetical protein